jgi:hypothetical protein
MNGASLWYAWPFAQRSQKESCEMRREVASIVAYSARQSTDRPTRRQIALNTCSSSAVTRAHSSMKSGRESCTGG